MTETGAGMVGVSAGVAFHGGYIRLFVLVCQGGCRSGSRACVRGIKGTRAHEFLSDFVGFCRILSNAGWIPAYAGMT